ncbi:MAG: hypothetical protein Kow0075_13960 [Salibacteraceae bacterium]
MATPTMFTNHRRPFYIGRLVFMAVVISGIFGHAHAQKVRISGKVYHPDDPTFNLLIVNKTTGTGVFGNADGSFDLSANKTDTLLIGAIGYKTEKVTMADSALKKHYHLTIHLRRLNFTLPEVRVMPQRELDSIQRDIRSLGYDEKDFMLSGIDAIQSPVTFLYQQISRKERQKRRAYEIINEDRKRALLKELFAKYVSYDIIDLDEQRFDEFIDFLNISDEQLKSMSQYEFIIYTKFRYEQFKRQPVRLRPDIDVHD